jgi:hypothetical protein
MKFNKTYGFILVAICLNCTQKNDQLSSEDKIKVTSEILQMFDNYHEDIKKDGLTAEFKYLDNSSDFYWVPPGYRSPLSYDSIQHILLANSKSIQSIEFAFDTISIHPIAKKIATYTGIVHGKMRDTSATYSSFKIIESGTLIKRYDGWKLLNGQSRNLSPE